MAIDHSAFEGFVVDGRVDTVISRGTVLVRENQYLGRPGHGRYVRRGLSSYLV
jgi:dihydropyrimidinase